MARQLLTLGLLAVTGAVAQAVAVSDYDYIVVGSGPGGAPLAANLARAGYPTLLLEAGDDLGNNKNYSEMANFNLAANDEKSRWDFFVKHSSDEEREGKYEHTTWRKPDGSFYVGLDPPEGSKRLGIYYPRSATLGGCAMHNGGVCSLPADDDWDAIAEKTGDDTWLAKNMRQYFERIETAQYVPADTPGHGYTGYLNVTISDPAFMQQSSDVQAIANSIIKTVGGEVTRDINSLDPDRDQATGVFGLASHADPTGHRVGTNTYVRATLDDPAKFPLTVQLQSLVTKILFSEDAKEPTAIGVEVLRGPSLYKADPRYNNTKGEVVKLFANKEVIVSGGAFNTPQILKLSGVGPAEELKKFDIPVVKDLPGVGEKLADNYEGSVLALASKALNGSSAGPIAVMLKTPTARKNRNIYGWCKSFSFEGFWPGYPTEYGPSQYECAFVHMNPRSQAGYVHLLSADPQEPPEINFNFFEDNGDEDLTEMLDAAKIFRKAITSVGAPIAPFNEKHPCPGENQNCTDEAQKEFLKLQTYSHHATSTCGIGPAEDKLAVLDSKFRVHGIKNLRVVDASAFPAVPGAFPVCPVFMLAEKATDDILGDAKAASSST
ncbi:putative GMC oxidoreductase [Hypoxylon trugodes]|uniref:putative GMC oxidoreductase n=1 Tax=Hypoxylon trugodes TaxID=326681 RepID=UPI002196C7AD|nr:putative GMC oxidoreductase [Hypoxylon trugodes]KAI1389137.1 putative GMC oxidoreductase [Hypoxylon trugodes]